MVSKRITGGIGIGGCYNSLLVFSINIAKLRLLNYFYVFAIKIALFHSSGCTHNTPNLPQPNASSLQNYITVSAKFRYTSIVSFQTADATFKTTSKKNSAPNIHLYFQL